MCLHFNIWPRIFNENKKVRNRYVYYPFLLIFNYMRIYLDMLHQAIQIQWLYVPI
jgi:hypothetical protein